MQGDTALETHEPESDAAPKPDNTTEDTRDIEVQATEDLYEDDFSKSNSEVSLDSQHSSGSERVESQAREEQSKASGHYHSRSSRATSISSEEKSSPDLEKSSHPPSEPDSIPPTSGDNVASQDDPVQSESPNVLDTKYENEAFEEPEVKEEFTEDLSGSISKDSLEHDNKLPEIENTSIPESEQVLDSGKQQASNSMLQLSDAEGQNEPKSPHPSTDKNEKANSTVSVNEATEHREDGINPQDNSPFETAESSVHESVEENQKKIPEQPATNNSTSNVNSEVSTKSLFTNDETVAAPNTVVSSPPTNLSPSLTLKEATRTLEKTSSAATSLSSLLNDGGSKIASSVDLSDQDEDIPQLEKKIHALSNPNIETSTDPTPASETAKDKAATPQHTSSSQIESTNQAEAEGSTDILEDTTEPSNEQNLQTASETQTDQAEEEHTVHTPDPVSQVELPKIEDKPEANSDSEIDLTSDTAATTTTKEETLPKDEPVSPTSIKDGQEVPSSYSVEKASSQLSLSSSLTSVSSQHTQSSS